MNEDDPLVEEMFSTLQSPNLCKEAKRLIAMAIYAQVFKRPAPLELLNFFPKETSENETPTQQKKDL